MTRHLAALTDLGGVNSIRSFTRSWQRAASFTEVIPQRPSFVFAPDQEPIGAPDGFEYERADVEGGYSTARSSLLRQHFERPPIAGILSENVPSPPAIPEEGPAVDHAGTSRSPLQRPQDFREREQKALESELTPMFRVGSATTTAESIFAIPPHLATPPIVGSYASSPDYGTIRSDSGQPMQNAAALWRQQQEAAAAGAAVVPDDEIPPILVKEVEQDGKIVLAVEGQSTLPQTVFNSIKYASLGSASTPLWAILLKAAWKIPLLTMPPFCFIVSS